jgi:hypothetical protein
MAAVALVVAGALGMAGCSSSSSAGAGAHPPAGTPHDVVLASVAKTSASSAHMTISVTISGSPSFGAGSGSGTSSAPSINESLSASGDFDFVTKSGQMTMTVPGTDGTGSATVEFRIVGQSVYLHVPQASSLVGGKPWIKVDLSAYESSLGSSGANAFGGATSGDPTQLLQLLQKLGAEVSEVGTSTVGGVPTTEYRGTLDLSKMIAQGPAVSAGPSVGQGLAQAFGLGAIPVSVWVDNEGRARQVAMDMAVLGIHLDMTLGLGDFGESVTVTPPPADQVADGTSLLQGGQLQKILKASTNLSA